MRPETLARPIAVDSEELVRRWAARAGSVLLQDADLAGRRHLYFAPRWTRQLRHGGAVRWSGAADERLLPQASPLKWPWQLSREWSAVESPCGLAGYVGYDAALHPAARHSSPPVFDIADSWFGLYDAVLSFGAGATELHVADLTALHTERPRHPNELWELRARELLEAPTAERSSPTPVTETQFLDRRWHRGAIDRIRRALRAGDAYQVNLTGHVRVRGGRDAYDHFRVEQSQNPTSHAAYLNLGDAIVASHSPERLLQLRGGRLRTSPIKGTTPGGGPQLSESSKDRAEHVMIVDLCRNDLGRVSRFGSVKVSSLMHGLRLRGLEHLQSHVDAELDPPRRDELFQALFPGGSITGAPKRRAMELIREVELHRRGVYTGSIGVVRCDGRAEWNIAIRTAVWQDGVCSFGCGGGIVIDSDPDAEYAEAHLKARSFLQSLSPNAVLTEALGR